MNRLGDINEGSVGFVTFSFKDKTGALSAPASASYRIVDALSGTQVKAETAIAPLAETAEIMLSATETTIINTSRDREEKIITVEAIYSSQPTAEEFTYEVVNLLKYPFPVVP